MEETARAAERARGEILGMPVLSISEGAPLGHIRQVLIDGKTYCVQGFVVEKRRGGKDDRILPFPAVVSFGEDGVTIERQAQLERKGASHQYLRALRRPLAIIGSRVFTTNGKTLGKVEEYRFSTTDGAISGLEISGGLFKESMLVKGKYIIAISPQTVMLKDEAIGEAVAVENAFRANMENAAETVREHAAALKTSTVDATKKLSASFSDAVSRLRGRDEPEALPEDEATDAPGSGTWQEEAADSAAAETAEPAETDDEAPSAETAEPAETDGEAAPAEAAENEPEQAG